MYRITFLDEEQLYHTFCMEGSETHVCQLDKDLGHDEGCARYGLMVKLRRRLSLDAQLYFKV